MNWTLFGNPAWTPDDVIHLVLAFMIPSVVIIFMLLIFLGSNFTEVRAVLSDVMTQGCDLVKTVIRSGDR